MKVLTLGVGMAVPLRLSSNTLSVGQEQFDQVAARAVLVPRDGVRAT